MGDFNINYANLNSISTLTNYDNHINALGCSQLVNLPTRVTPTTSSVIDHIYVNHAALTCINPAGIQHDFSDHMPVIVEYRKTSIKKKMQCPATGRFCKTSFELFLADLQTRSETPEFQQSDNLSYLINLLEYRVTALSASATCNPNFASTLSGLPLGEFLRGELAREIAR